MLRFLYADQLHKHPKLAQGMFQDRADQFKTRLKWDVTVNGAGEEKDSYDTQNPLYVIWETAEGHHGGSMRFLPTTGPIMVNDHFGHLISGPISSPHIWECTRFCLARKASPHVAAALMLGGGEVMRGFEVDHFVGVFDARMVRIYKRTGAAPEVLGSHGIGHEAVHVGLWSFDAEDQEALAQRAGLPIPQIRQWFEMSFGSIPRAALKKAG